MKYGAFSFIFYMKIAITDIRISNKCERALEKEGFFLIKLPPDHNLGTAVQSHPDTLLFYSGGEIITTADYCEDAPYVFTDLREYCQSIKITFTADERRNKYPLDCVMNALVVEDKIFCKSDTVSKAIIRLAERQRLEICHVKQGYPACTTLAFGNNAITADAGMADALSKKGVKVTLINNGDISLPPYEYGFIGGASAVYENKVYFLGDLSTHRDGVKIRSAIESAGYKVISLSDEPLSDLGGIIFL